MLPELLPYKYSNLKFADDYKEKTLTNLGWKARKYIKWSDVHINEDRDLLRDFADKAIEEGVLSSELFPRINEILLNVQRWRLDKKGFSIEPSHRPEWDRAFSIITSAKEDLGIISSFLSESKIDIDILSDEQLIRVFENKIIAELVINVRLPKQKTDISNAALEDKQCLIDALRSHYPEIYELDGVNTEDLFSAFGLPSLAKIKGPLPRREVTIARTIYSFEGLPPTELFRFQEQGDFTAVKINKNNTFVTKMRAEKESEDILKRLVKVIHEVKEKRVTSSKQIEEYIKFLTVSLDEEFEDYDDLDFE